MSDGASYLSGLVDETIPFYLISDDNKQTECGAFNAHWLLHID